MVGVGFPVAKHLNATSRSLTETSMLVGRFTNVGGAVGQWIEYQPIGHLNTFTLIE